MGRYPFIPLAEKLSNRSLSRVKSLYLSSRFEPTHLTFALATRFIGYLLSVDDFQRKMVFAIQCFCLIYATRLTD